MTDVREAIMNICVVLRSALVTQQPARSSRSKARKKQPKRPTSRASGEKLNDSEEMG